MSRGEGHALSVRNLSKTFATGVFAKPKKVLDSVSFTVPLGKVTGFVGANGSGKTTTLKCIFDFINRDAGQVEFFTGQTLDSVSKARIGFFPERPYLYDFLSAREFLKLHWELSGGGAGFAERESVVLQQVDLGGVERKTLRSFSKGMQQRIGIAQAILRDPELLILDEPMSGLDPDGRFLIKEIIRDLAARGKSIFFSSHLLNDLDELCQYLVVIEGGKILYEGGLTEFKNGLDLGGGAKAEISLEKAFHSFRTKCVVQK